MPSQRALELLPLRGTSRGSIERTVRNSDASFRKSEYHAHANALDCWALAVGLCALTLLNVLRITSLYAVGTALLTKVAFLLLNVWPFVMVTVATLLFSWKAAG